MLQSLISRAQRGVDAIVSKYVSRATVAVPFVIAAGFGTAAIAMKLSQDYGTVTAYASLAGLFAIVGTVTAMVVNANANSGNVDALTAGVSATKPGDRKGSETSGLVDREAMMALLASVAPLAMPVVLRVISGKRVVFLVVLAALAYIFLRPSASLGTPSEPTGPVAT